MPLNMLKLLSFLQLQGMIEPYRANQQCPDIGYLRPDIKFKSDKMNSVLLKNKLLKILYFFKKTYLNYAIVIKEKNFFLLQAFY